MRSPLALAIHGGKIEMKADIAVKIELCAHYEKTVRSETVVLMARSQGATNQPFPRSHERHRPSMRRDSFIH
jgi:hypothetical protein